MGDAQMVGTTSRGSRRRRAGASRVVALVTLLLLMLLVPSIVGDVGAGTAAANHGHGAPLQVAAPPSRDYFYVNFTETNLPTGAPWTVTLTGASIGTTSNSTIAPGVNSFQELNGSYSFSVSSTWCFSPTPSIGSVQVNGSSTTNGTAWSGASCTLRFQESGLPAGDAWTTVVNGVSNTSTTPSIVYTNFPGGTSYSYTVSSQNSSWSPSPASGSGILTTNASPPISVTFAPATYIVTFAEQNLPAGTTWTVTVAGMSPVSQSAPNTIVISLVSGSYTYTATSSNNQWSGTGGSFNVTGGPVFVPVTFPLKYTVSFVANVVPGGGSWNVTLAGVLGSSTTNTIVFQMTNGTYPFLVGPAPGWSSSPASGNITVRGGASGTSITWTRFPYNVTFNESGITSNTRWWVNISGPAGSSSHPGFTVSGTTIVLNEPNGTYFYNITVDDKQFTPTPSQSSGSFVVAGRDLNYSVTFTEILSTVTFSESRLPSGMQWWAFANGGPQYKYNGTSTTSTIALQVPNGTYVYNITSVNRSWGAPGGSFNVTGSPLTIPVNFTNFLFPVTFDEIGLIPGTEWGVAIYGQLQNSTGVSMTFNEPNGTYDYVVSPVAGYTLYRQNGSFGVYGHPVGPINITYHPVSFSIRFNETGLPRGSAWWVNVTWTNQTSVGAFELTSSSGFIPLANGTYLYTVESANKSYTPEAPQGSLTVNGTGFNVSVTFILFGYPVTFTETGLPAGAIWSADFAGSSGASSNSSITFLVPNGTYPFVISDYGVYYPAPASGNLTVNGSATNLTVRFVRALFAVTFVESGLPAGTSWSVTLNGRSETTVKSTLVFYEGNGTFPYQVSIPVGPAPNPASGSVHVFGSDVAVTINFGSSGGSSSLSEPEVILIGALLVGGVIVLGAWLVGRRPSTPR